MVPEADASSVLDSEGDGTTSGVGREREALPGDVASLKLRFVGLALSSVSEKRPRFGPPSVSPGVTAKGDGRPRSARPRLAAAGCDTSEAPADPEAGFT